jgi:hypothetical protein
MNDNESENKKIAEEKKRLFVAKVMAEIPDERRESFDVAVHMTLDSVKKTFPEIENKDVLGRICECIARIVSGFQLIPLGQVTDAMESMFNAYIVASASLEGLVDLGEPSAKYKEFIEAMEKAMAEEHAAHEHDHDIPEDNKPHPYTGQYL